MAYIYLRLLTTKHMLLPFRWIHMPCVLNTRLVPIYDSPVCNFRRLNDTTKMHRVQFYTDRLTLLNLIWPINRILKRRWLVWIVYCNNNSFNSPTIGVLEVLSSHYNSCFHLDRRSLSYCTKSLTYWLLSFQPHSEREIIIETPSLYGFSNACAFLFARSHFNEVHLSCPYHQKIALCICQDAAVRQKLGVISSNVTSRVIIAYPPRFHVHNNTLDTSSCLFSKKLKYHLSHFVVGMSIYARHPQTLKARFAVPLVWFACRTVSCWSIPLSA